MAGCKDVGDTRLALRQKAKIAQKLPDDLEKKVTSFHKYVINLRKRCHFEIAQINNMDETPMCFDLPPNWTVDSKGTVVWTVLF